MSESVVYRTAGMIDRNLANVKDPAEALKRIEEYDVECSMVKVWCSEMLDYCVDETVQLFGGAGYVEDYPAERFWRDSRVNRIFEGTNEINRLLVPGTILGRALKGEIPLQKEVMKAMDALMSPSLDELDPSVPFAAEKATRQTRIPKPSERRANRGFLLGSEVKRLRASIAYCRRGRGHTVKGATGVAVRTLINLVMNLAAE